MVADEYFIYFGTIGGVVAHSRQIGSIELFTPLLDRLDQVALLSLQHGVRVEEMLLQTIDQRYGKSFRVVDRLLFGDHNQAELVVYGALDAVRAQAQVNLVLTAKRIIVLVQHVINHGRVLLEC